MKGIIFTLLNELVEEKFGLSTWDGLLRDCEVDGIYTVAETYPDTELLSLVTRLSETSGIGSPDLIRTFGTYLLPGFAAHYPVFFPPGMTARGLLLSVDSIIHKEVKKFYPEALLPRFDYEEPAPNQLVMIYRSTRKLCPLVEGLIDGTAEYFGETITRVQTQCVCRGDEQCRFELAFGA